MALALSIGVGAPTSAISSEGDTLETFFMEAPQDVLAVTHNGDKPLPTFPSGVGLMLPSAS
jgi:hypothetical protein